MQMKEAFDLAGFANIFTNAMFEQPSPMFSAETGKYVLMSSLDIIPLLSFDVRCLRGRKILNARLSMQVAGDDFPLEFEVTTITDHWDCSGATLFSSGKGEPWGDGRWLNDFIMGNGNSMHERQVAEFNERTGIISASIPINMIYAMIHGQSCGFGLIDRKSKTFAMDETGWLFTKKFHANDVGFMVPKLEIEYEGHDTGGACKGYAAGEACKGYDTREAFPRPVSGLQASALPVNGSPESASILLQWASEMDLNEAAHEYRFYNIYLSEHTYDVDKMLKLEAYLSPIHHAGNWIEQTRIDKLKPNTEYHIAVTVSNGMSDSPAVRTYVKTHEASSMPVIPEDKDQDDNEIAPFCIKEKTFTLYILDELSKVNPISGNILECGSETYRTGDEGNIATYGSGIFDRNIVHLVGVAGEKLGFQLVSNCESP